MLGLLSVVAITFGQQPPQLSRAKGSLRGRAVHAISGEPLRKVSISLVPQSPHPDPSATRLRSFVTGADGTFAADGLDPDRYTIVAYRLGFSRAYYGARRSGLAMPVEIRAGETLTGITVKLTPHSILSGTVVDSDGDPLPAISVVAIRIVYLQGERQVESVGHSLTDDLGRFRIPSLGSGRYYLVVLPNRAPAELEGKGGIGPVFFPGVSGFDRASLLTLEPGQHIEGLRMTLRRIPAVMVSGRILNLPAGDDSEVMVRLETRDLAGRLMDPTSNGAEVKDGSFVIRNVPPGSYLLTAAGLRGAGLEAQVALEVGDHDIENVTLDMRAGSKVEGRLIWPDQPGNEERNRAVQIGARYPPPSDHSRFSGVDPDGKFRLSGLLPGPYRVVVANLPPGMYARSAKVGKQDIFEEGLRPGGDGILEVAISADAAELRGSARNAEEQPVAGATVVLVPARESPYRMLIRFAVTDQNGAFRFPTVVPGEYRAWAWEDVEDGAWYDPEFREKHQAAAVPVVLGENGRKEIQLRAIPAH